MSYIAAKCPNCTGDLNVDDKLERGYFIHCGTSVSLINDVQNVKIVGSVKVPSVPKLNELLKLIKKDLESGSNQTKEFRNNLKRALELDPDNKLLYNLHISKIWNAKIKDGVLHKYNGNAKKFIVPYCIKHISKHAFFKCTNLSEIVIPKNVATIEDDAFANSPSLTISTYCSTCAVKYAINNQTSLFLLDGTEDVQAFILKVKDQMKDIRVINNATRKKILNYISTNIKKRKRYKRIFFTMLISLFLFIIYSPSFSVMQKGVFSVLFCISIVIYDYNSRYNPFPNTNSEIKYYENMIYKEFNAILSNADTLDNKYQIGSWIFNSKYIDDASKKAEMVKNRLLSIDPESFYIKYKNAAIYSTKKRK